MGASIILAAFRSWGGGGGRGYLRGGLIQILTVKHF